MKKLINKKVFAIIMVVVFLAIPVLTMASTAADITGLADAKGDLGDTDVRSIINTIISVILGFLGLIAVVLILVGGFMWMTAGGNEDKVKTGRQYIINGVIGLVIILAAYAIASFVITNLGAATGLGDTAQ